MKPMSIYLCSPFFNDEEVARVKKMEKFLEDRGYQLYSPMRDGGVLTPDATAEDRLRTYQDNVREVLAADLAIAIISTKDVGTNVEVGLRAGAWEHERNQIFQIQQDDPEILTKRDKVLLAQETPRLITFADNGTNVNVMLLGAVLRHCGSWEELGEYLDYVDEVGIDNAKRDKESISSVKVY